MKLNLHLLVNIMTVMRMGFTNVFAVELIFSNPKPNLILVLAGPVSGLRLQKRILQPKLTEAYSWYELKYFAPVAMHT
jgi:hypothetical protein